MWVLACVGTLVAAIWLILIETAHTSYGGSRLNDAVQMAKYLIPIWAVFCLALYVTGWGIAWAIAGFKNK